MIRLIPLTPLLPCHFTIPSSNQLCKKHNRGWFSIQIVPIMGGCKPQSSSMLGGLYPVLTGIILNKIFLLFFNFKTNVFLNAVYNYEIFLPFQADVPGMWSERIRVPLADTPVT
jgi:hypothetical protein